MLTACACVANQIYRAPQRDARYFYFVWRCAFMGIRLRGDNIIGGVVRKSECDYLEFLEDIDTTDRSGLKCMCMMGWTMKAVW